MSHLLKALRALTRRLVVTLLVAAAAISCLTQPVYADAAPAPKRFIAADGTDLTAMAECLPKQLSKSNFSRAIKESGNDFLERVLLNFKGTYSDRKLSEAEIAYRECLQQKGIELDEGR